MENDMKYSVFNYLSKQHWTQPDVSFNGFIISNSIYYCTVFFNTIYNSNKKFTPISSYLMRKKEKHGTQPPPPPTSLDMRPINWSFHLIWRRKKPSITSSFWRQVTLASSKSSIRLFRGRPQLVPRNQCLGIAQNDVVFTLAACQMPFETWA